MGQTDASAERHDREAFELSVKKGNECGPDNVYKVAYVKYDNSINKFAVKWLKYPVDQCTYEDEANLCIPEDMKVFLKNNPLTTLAMPGCVHNVSS